MGFAEIDPVPEPAPDLGTSGIPAEIEALIPSPDALPRAVDRPVPGDPSADLVPVTRVSPAFPALARSVRAEGSVSLIASIAADGHVEDARLVGCSRPGVGFESAAMEAVRRWKYPPAPPGSAAREVALRIEFRGGGAAR